MKMTMAVVTFLCFAPTVRTPGGGDLPLAAREAMAAGGRADAAIAVLRDAGPAGLEAFLDVHRDLAAVLDTAPEVGPAPDLARFRAVLDRIGAQRDDWASHLYWFTDLERAKAEAVRTGRPILSLRLLGRLDEELSCANSRFFRTVLYANARVGALLREGFVLHWSSERAAPRITVDYGCGRRLVRTITGNSIHYVLDHGGNVIDALPGLYGPGRFASELESVRAYFAALHPESRTCAGFAHAERVLQRLRSPESQRQLRMSLMAEPMVQGDDLTPVAGVPAVAAGVRAASKLPPERPLLRAAIGAPRGIAAMPGSPMVDPDSRLDESSLRVLRAKCPPAVRNDPAALQRTVAAFERSIGIDTVRNDLLLRRQCLERLCSARAPFADFNGWVYATVFLTPASDPWLGLVPDDVYTAIEGGGIVNSVENRVSMR